MTIRYVHRNGGPGTPISFAGQFQEGYSEEALDDATSDELRAFLDPPLPVSELGVDMFRDARLAAGYADAATGKTYQADGRSIGLLTPIGSAAGLAVAMATSPAPSFAIIAADNSIVTLAAADAYALLQGRVMPWVSATMLYARTLKNAIAAGTPPADITTGWP